MKFVSSLQAWRIIKKRRKKEIVSEVMKIGPPIERTVEGRKA